MAVSTSLSDIAIMFLPSKRSSGSFTNVPDYLNMVSEYRGAYVVGKALMLMHRIGDDALTCCSP